MPREDAALKTVVKRREKYTEMKVFGVFSVFRCFKPILRVNFEYKCIIKICKVDIFRIFN